jgi:hypothetical protein
LGIPRQVFLIYKIRICYFCFNLEYLPIHNSNDFVFTTDGYQIAIVGPGCLASTVSELIWRISENLKANTKKNIDEKEH